MIALRLVAGIVVILVLGMAYLYNRLVVYKVRVDNGWSQIDVQLKRRHDLIPNLVETVKGYAAHEKDLFEHIAQVRTQAMGATGVGDQAKAEGQVSSGLRQLLAVAENYPDLKASTNFLSLQEELSGTESKIAYARQFYNDQVMRLNTAIQSFPSSVIARLFRFTPREFFEMDDAARGPISVDI